MGFLQQVNDRMTVEFLCNIKVPVNSILNSSLTKLYRDDELGWRLVSHLLRKRTLGQST